MLTLLDRLKSVIQDFAERRNKFDTEFHSRFALEQKAFEKASEERQSRAAVAMADADAAFGAEKDRKERKFERRKDRITRAHTIASEQVREGTDRLGRQQHEIQEQSRELEIRRDAELADSKNRLENFETRLADSQAAFAPIEKSARRDFRGYGRFRRLLAAGRRQPESNLPPDDEHLFNELHQLQLETGEELGRFEKIALPKFFKFLPLWQLTPVLLGGAAAAIFLPLRLGLNLAFSHRLGLVLGVLWLLLLGVHRWGWARVGPYAKTIATKLARAGRLHDRSRVQIDTWFQQEQERILTEFEQNHGRVNEQWKQLQRKALDTRGARAQAVDDKAFRALQKNEQLYRAHVKVLEQVHTAQVTRLREVAAAEEAQLAAVHESKLAALKADQQARRQALDAEWETEMRPIHQALRAADAAAKDLFPDWAQPSWKDWTPPQEFKNAAKFGRLEVDVWRLAEMPQKDSRLTLPFRDYFSVPLLLKYPSQGSILLETTKSGGDEAVATINNIIFRLLSAHPPGKLSFTIFDPVGLGQNFAGLMHLADYEEGQINSRIWTQTNQLEEKLAELNEHMEKVIQMYLRNEYETIAEYNAQAGTIAEKYHMLVLADFPVNFSETAGRRLINIATSGARCGVYTLIHWDRRHALPQGFVADELRKNSLCLTRADGGFRLDQQPGGTRLKLDPAPPSEFVTDFLQRVGERSRDSNRVEVPFEQVAPADSDLWTEETAEELTVPIGRSGATKLQRLEIGKGTRQHVLIAGKTGSGKSTLFHVIVTNLSLWCSPEQVEFYLVDFKKGVEFKCYASRRLPHAKVVAIESDREFGLSVLQRVDQELRRRGDLFRELGVQDVAGYKRAGGKEPMPRSLLIIDEFQEFFVEEDRVSQGAAVLLDRIVRQGRAFGIHVLLGSQTLGGAYTLARATIGQMVIRIALMCNEADAYLIMDQDNPAPRLLTRPGEGIYNDTAGSIEGNSPFQTVWLPESVRDGYLAKVRDYANHNGGNYPGPFVFEGNAPADVRENLVLREALQAKPAQPPGWARLWLGAPNSIKGPTEAVFQKQSGSNLLIVGQSEERTMTLMAVALVSLSAQYPNQALRFVLLDSTPPGIPQREFLERVIAAVPHEIIQSNNSNLADIMTGLTSDLKRRASGEKSGVPDTFVLVHGLQNYKKLRQEDEFSFSSSESGPNPAAALLNLITEGPGHGFHVVAACDTYNNVSRFIGRKTLAEFEMRVLFQMSASDSASLIDAPDASTLGLHRALYYNDREGYIETFRPYALPGGDWVEEAARQLGKR